MQASVIEKLKVKISSLNENLRAKSFDLQIWFVITVIGSLRVLKAVVQDVASGTGTNILIVDALILSVLAAICISILNNKIQRVHLLVGLSLLILVTISYIQFGGVLGMSEFNLMGLCVLLTLGYSGRKLLIILVLYFILVVFANMDLTANGILTHTFFKEYSTSLDNYFTTLITLLILMIYFKNLLTRETLRIRELRVKLSSHNKQIRNKHMELADKQPLLHEANRQLESEISKHTNQILIHNKAIEDYLILSSRSLHIPLESIKSNSNELTGEDFLIRELNRQIDELDHVIQGLNGNSMANGQSN